MNFDNVTKDEMISMLKERGISHEVNGEQLRVMDLTLLPGAARAYFNQQTGEWTGEAQEVPATDAIAAAKESGGKEQAETEAQIAATKDQEPLEVGKTVEPGQDRERGAGDASLSPANGGMGGTEEYLAEVAQSIKENGGEDSAKSKSSEKAGEK
jgi:hypothetical protein